MRTLNRMTAAVIAAVLLSGLFLKPAHAGTVTAFVPPAVGPGLGTAGAIINGNGAPNNGPDAPNPGFPTYQININKQFDNVGYIDMQFTVAASGGTVSYFLDDNVKNNTGLDWTDFHFQIGFGTGNAFVQSTGALNFYGVNNTALPFSNAFSDSTLKTATIAASPAHAYADNWSTGVFTAGTTQPFHEYINVPDALAANPPSYDPLTGAYTFTIREMPSVPEPSSAILMGTCLIGLMAYIRRRRQ